MATSKLEGIGLENEQIEHIQLDRGLLDPDIEVLYGLGPRDKAEAGEPNGEGDNDV